VSNDKHVKIINFVIFFYYIGRDHLHVGLVDQIQEIMSTFHSSEVAVVVPDKIFF